MSAHRLARIVVVVALGCGPLYPAHAAAPPLRYDTTSLAELVLDKHTGLTWQAMPSAGGLSWMDAQTHCARLALASGGFRVPTYKELMTLVDPTASAPAIDRGAFPDTPSEEFWSSTPVAGTPGFGWTVSFNYGKAVPGDMTFAFRVRCVR